jgi:Sodium/hydrogen exchanger family
LIATLLAIMRTFLAGAELDPGIFRTRWKEAIVVGLVGFFAPFLGAAAVAHFLLRWSVPSSWLAGVALSTTSVAVVYAVMLELGLNRADTHLCGRVCWYSRRYPLSLTGSFEITACLRRSISFAPNRRVGAGSDCYSTGLSHVVGGQDCK